jgi:hypothetical protein
MQLRLVDVIVEVARYHEMHCQNGDPLQDNADEPVHRDADESLAELAVAVGDRADDDGGQRDVVRAGKYDRVGSAVDEHQLPQLSRG